MVTRSRTVILLYRLFFPKNPQLCLIHKRGSDRKRKIVLSQTMVTEDSDPPRQPSLQDSLMGMKSVRGFYRYYVVSEDL